MTLTKASEDAAAPNLACPISLNGLLVRMDIELKDPGFLGRNQRLDVLP